MEKLNALVIGATGATGQEIVSQLLEDNSFNSVSIFVRKDPNITHSKLKTYIIDFSKVEEYKELIKGDVLFSCLGTTIRDAGSKDKQYLVDYTHQYEFAKIASDNGVSIYSLVSSSGANQTSPFFYPRIKGKLEEEVKKLPFKTIHIFQPPILIRQKNLIRTGEEIAIKIFKKLNRLRILKSQNPLPVSELAKVMIDHLRIKQKEKIKTIKNFY